MDDLEYYFDGRKSGISEAYVKGVFQEMFKNKESEIFNVIWGNTTLRGSLFPETIGLNTNDLNNIKPSVLIKFRNNISTTSNLFYNFIQVK